MEFFKRKRETRIVMSVEIQVLDLNEGREYVYGRKMLSRFEVV